MEIKYKTFNCKKGDLVLANTTGFQKALSQVKKIEMFVYQIFAFMMKSDFLIIRSKLKKINLSNLINFRNIFSII